MPVFNNGDQIGERRHFDERLTMFLLRTRDPARFGKWIDGVEARQVQDGAFAIFSFRLGRMVRAAWRAFDAAWRGAPAPQPEPEMLAPGARPFDDERGR